MCLVHPVIVDNINDLKTTSYYYASNDPKCLFSR